MSDSTFHMPILRADFLSSNTRKAFDKFLAAGHVHKGLFSHKDEDCRVIAIVTDYHVGADDRESITPDARITIISETEGGHVSEFSPNILSQRSLSDFAAVSLAWVNDNATFFNAQAGIIPARKGAYRDPSCGKLLRHIHALDFGLFGREYPVIAAGEINAEILGPQAQLDDRRLYMNLLLPPVRSAHEEMEQLSRADRIENLTRRIYECQMDGQLDEAPLAPFDFSTIFSL